MFWGTFRIRTKYFMKNDNSHRMSDQNDNFDIQIRASADVRVGIERRAWVVR